MNEQLNREVREGIEAAELLRHSAFGRAFDELRGNLHAQLERVSINDTETQTKLVLSLQLLKSLRGSLEAAVETGEMAQMQLEKPSLLRRVIG